MTEGSRGPQRPGTDGEGPLCPGGAYEAVMVLELLITFPNSAGEGASQAVNLCGAGKGKLPPAEQGSQGAGEGPCWGGG